MITHSKINILWMTTNLLGFVLIVSNNTSTQMSDVVLDSLVEENRQRRIKIVNENKCLIAIYCPLPIVHNRHCCTHSAF